MKEEDMNQHVYKEIISCDKVNALLFKEAFKSICSLFIEILFLIFLAILYVLTLVENWVLIVVLVTRMISIFMSIYSIYKIKKIL